MRYYFAPMEGLTDSIYRRLHAAYFPGIDCYYTPFFSPTIHRTLTPREERELPISPGFPVVPQILTKSSDDFIWMSQICAERGYPEVNLNLGCPSGTVTAKGKGAGMLKDLSALQHFLDSIFSMSALPISIKTRIGFSEPDHFPELLNIYNQYPVKELIVHPRIKTDFYSSPLRMEYWNYAADHSSAPLCYNGDLCSIYSIRKIHTFFPHISSVMIGRGLIGDPGMLLPEGTARKSLSDFYSDLLEEYIQAFGGSRNAMFRMKENWRYLLCRFEGSERLGKKLRKTTDMSEYKEIVSEIFATLPLRPALEPDWLNSYSGIEITSNICYNEE